MFPPSIIATVCAQLREIEMVRDSGQATKLEIQVTPRMVGSGLDGLAIDLWKSEYHITSIQGSVP